MDNEITEKKPDSFYELRLVNRITISAFSVVAIIVAQSTIFFAFALPLVCEKVSCSELTFVGIWVQNSIILGMAIIMIFYDFKDLNHSLTSF